MASKDHKLMTTNVPGDKSPSCETHTSRAPPFATESSQSPVHHVKALVRTQVMDEKAELPAPPPVTPVSTEAAKEVHQVSASSPRSSANPDNPIAVVVVASKEESVQQPPPLGNKDVAKEAHQIVTGLSESPVKDEKANFVRKIPESVQITPSIDAVKEFPFPVDAGPKTPIKDDKGVFARTSTQDNLQSPLLPSSKDVTKGAHPVAATSKDHNPTSPAQDYRNAIAKLRETPKTPIAVFKKQECALAQQQESIQSAVKRYSSAIVKPPEVENSLANKYRSAMVKTQDSSAKHVDENLQSPADLYKSVLIKSRQKSQSHEDVAENHTKAVENSVSPVKDSLTHADKTLKFPQSRTNDMPKLAVDSSKAEADESRALAASKPQDRRQATPKLLVEPQQQSPANLYRSVLKMPRQTFQLSEKNADEASIDHTRLLPEAPQEPAPTSREVALILATNKAHQEPAFGTFKPRSPAGRSLPESSPRSCNEEPSEHSLLSVKLGLPNAMTSLQNLAESSLQEEDSHCAGAKADLPPDTCVSDSEVNSKESLKVPPPAPISGSPKVLLEPQAHGNLRPPVSKLQREPASPFKSIKETSEEKFKALQQVTSSGNGSVANLEELASAKEPKNDAALKKPKKDAVFDSESVKKSKKNKELNKALKDAVVDSVNESKKDKQLKKAEKEAKKAVKAAKEQKKVEKEARKASKDAKKAEKESKRETAMEAGSNAKKETDIQEVSIVHAAEKKSLRQGYPSRRTRTGASKPGRVSSKTTELKLPSAQSETNGTVEGKGQKKIVPFPTPPEPHFSTRLADLGLEQGNEAYLQKDYQKAVHLFSQGIMKCGNDALSESVLIHLHMRRAMACVELQDKDHPHQPKSNDDALALLDLAKLDLQACLKAMEKTKSLATTPLLKKQRQAIMAKLADIAKKLQKCLVARGAS